MINFQPVSNVLGALITILGTLMLLIGIIFLGIEPDAIDYFGSSALVCFLVGAALWVTKFSTKNTVNKREGYLIVTLSWVFVGLFGALPYIFSDVTTNLTDTVFESVSGLTTTGATIFVDIESLPKSILLWRSLTQWIGGMGIIVLTVAIFPLFGIGGFELFSAEAPGPKSSKIHPRIKETAKRLYYIYVGLTITLFILLWIEGMTGFDAINHALTTMATGGFSTKNNSIAYFDSAVIQYTIVIFMFIAGTNYSLLYFGLKGKFSKFFYNDEFRFYVIVVAIFTISVLLGIMFSSVISLEEGFRKSIFQVVSMITTTGYITDDYTAYTPFITTLFFMALFFGASAGSTAGGIKLVRHLVLLRNSFYEFKRLIHPRAIIRTKLDGVLVRGKITTHIMVFILIYLSIFMFGTMIISSMGMSLDSSAGAVATALGNVGPGIGEVGPVNNFSEVPWIAKWILSIIMILGRLELFTVLIIFTPFFWKSN